MKKQNGITLIALVVTIVVLLILAGVALNLVLGENGIITRGQEAKIAHEVGAEKEDLKLNVADWEISKKEDTFFSFMKGKYGEGNVEDLGNNTVKVIMEKTGNQYIVSADGTIVENKGINISISEIKLAPEETTTITATLNNITGKITWESKNTNVATIDVTEGDTITITAVGAGETTIIATCGDYSKECKITVEEVPVNPVAGTYYLPGMKYSITLNNDTDLTVTVNGPEGLVGDEAVEAEEWKNWIKEVVGSTYTYTETNTETIVTINGTDLNLYELTENNNRILLCSDENNDRYVLVAMNRNGLEGENISGTYIDSSRGGATDYQYIIDSENGTWVEMNGSEEKGSGNYFYYNNIIYNIFDYEGIVDEQAGTFLSSGGTTWVKYSD